MSNINNSILTLSEESFKGPSILLLDSLKRIQFNSSYWHSFFNRKEKQKLNEEMWNTVSSFFQNRYQIEDSQHFLRIWKEIGQNKWSIKSAFTVGRLRDIDAAFKRHLIYHGPGIKPLPAETCHINPTVQQVVNALLHGGSLSTDLIRKPILQAILVKHDPDLLKEFRAEMQLELNYLVTNPPKNAQEEIVWRQFLGNILAILPFTYPLENEIFYFPFLDADRTCRLVEYKTNIIELTPKALTTPVSALGFIPTIDTQAVPILSYIGTTFPAGSGFSECIKADFTPKMSVGEEIYRLGKEKIALWIQDKKNVHVVGTSLGGAMALHTILDHHHNLSRVDVFNPPGLYNHNWKKRTFNKGCPINIYRQPGDIVSKMGFWPTGAQVKIYNIIPHQAGVVEGMPRSHIQVFSGCHKVTFLQNDPQVENKNLSRKILVFMHRFFGPYIFYYPTCFMVGCYKLARSVQKCWKDCFKY